MNENMEKLLGGVDGKLSQGNRQGIEDLYN
jgi:hypothetical protein